MAAHLLSDTLLTLSDMVNAAIPIHYSLKKMLAMDCREGNEAAEERELARLRGGVADSPSSLLRAPGPRHLIPG
jgi:hypothetical protein